jgi:hypothetical protein
MSLPSGPGIMTTVQPKLLNCQARGHGLLPDTVCS